MRNRRRIRSWIVVQDNPETTRKELTQMKKRKGLRSWMSVMLMAAAVMGMCLLFAHVPAQAAVTCPTTSTADPDGDGFTNQQECDGITLADGSHFYGKTEGIARGLSRDQYLDPDSKDLFVILVPANPSNFPGYQENPPNPLKSLEYVSKPQSGGGLGFIVHVINSTQASSSRVVSSSSTQKAVKVTESLDESNSNILGFSSCGTPNGLDLATVYTKRIINFVNSVYGGATLSSDLIDTYIKHTIAHEVGHMVGPLAPKYNASYGGYHYKTGTNVIMDQSVYYKGITFYIGTTYTSADQTGAKLK
jgi:hypothetical protein